MKILVVEYITGGGLNKQDLPGSLAEEGRLMLQALLDNLSVIPGLEIELMLDWRLFGQVNITGVTTVLVNSGHDFLAKFRLMARHCQAVWPIAPESDGILQSLCQIIQNLNLKLLTSPACAVALTGNKLSTYQQLLKHNIATVPTDCFRKTLPWPGEWIVKPVDGVACADSYVITNESELAALPTGFDTIIQPHINGLKTSISCLFKQGQAWLLCVNKQDFNLLNQQYQLRSITVNFSSDLNKYRQLAADIAKAFPDLWGYVGIDLIETTEHVLVLEINPRLTSSFVGIQQALGINVAELVLQLLAAGPDIAYQCNQPVTLNFNQHSHVE